jgi:hypothetical protein
MEKPYKREGDHGGNMEIAKRTSAAMAIFHFGAAILLVDLKRGIED